MRRIALFPLLAVLALTPALTPALTFGEQDGVPFPKLKDDLLRRAGTEVANADLFDLHAFLEEHYVHARVGLFDAYLSRASAEDAGHAGSYAQMLLALLDVQEAWLDWLEPEADVEQAKDDLQTLRKWARSVRGGEIRSLARREEKGDLLDLVKARDSAVEARDRLAEVLGTGTHLGLERPDTPEPIVLAPTRVDFLEHAGLAGWIHPDLQGVFWNTAITHWTQFYVDDVNVFALEYAQPGTFDWALGTSMDEAADQGMAQQVTQLAALALLDGYFGDRISPAMAGGLSINLTIDVFGECDTRVDGDLQARRTEAREVFVPGGLSEGGVLPVLEADSRWREEQGADHFVSVLAASLRAGERKARNRASSPRHFLLMNDTESERLAVRGPFLGSTAVPQEVPEDFRGDELEFLRSYRSCFLHWLQEESVGSANDSRLAFARFLKKAAEPGADLEAAFPYAFSGRPLSDGGVSPETLEGTFLRWLARR